MQTFTRTYPDGTKGTYTVAPGSSLPMTLATLKFLHITHKLRKSKTVKPTKRPPLARAAKRQFPGYAPGITSTRDYINAYFSLNSHPKIAAWPRHCTDWLSLYQPLPDEPAAVSDIIETIETIEE